MRLVAVTVLCVGLAGCGGPVSDAKKLVAHDLKDPSSAQFREIKTVADTVCGEVNAKNAYGAYVGFKHFFVRDGRVTMEPEAPSERLSPNISRSALDQWTAYQEFSGVWQMRCQSTLPSLPSSLDPDFPLLDKWVKEH